MKTGEWCAFVDGEFGSGFECSVCHQYSYLPIRNGEPVGKRCPKCNAYMVDGQMKWRSVCWKEDK